MTGQARSSLKVVLATTRTGFGFWTDEAQTGSNCRNQAVTLKTPGAGVTERYGDFATVTQLRTISCMTSRHLRMFVAMEAFVLLCAAAGSPAQVEPSSVAPEQQVVLSRLSSPMYPPLARQARISGDVDLVLRIRQDGIIESAEVVSGHHNLHTCLYVRTYYVGEMLRSNRIPCWNGAIDTTSSWCISIPEPHHRPC
jgi:hypothetical protein